MKKKRLQKSYVSHLIAALLMFTLVINSAFVVNENPVSPKADIVEHDTDGNAIVIYPNPLTENYMYLEAGKSGIICMYDADGNRIFKSNYEAGKNKLDISTVKKNTYTVKIISDNAMAYTTFQLERG